MARNSTRTDIEQRALGAMLSNAFFTWPSAVNAGFFLAMFFLVQLPFTFWQPWMWLLAGVITEVVYLVATLTDPKAGSEAVQRMLTEKYSPASIHNTIARQRLQKALDYKDQIDKFVGQQGGALKASLEQTASDINDMIGLIYRLARKIDTFEMYAQTNQNRNTVASDIISLKKRLSIETDAGIKGELSEGVRIKQQLLDQLDQIDSTAKRAEIQMDNTLTQLSTMYAQMQVIDSKDLDSGRAQRLRQDIREQISALSDTISAMDDVYQKPGDQGAVDRLSEDTGSAASGISTSTGVQRAQSGSQRQ